jgi:UDP-N-acetylmuramoyl-L-alanyl-D-glutamate-L-lysine ligase
MKTQNLLANIKVKKIIGNLPEEILAIEVDSRKIGTNHLFICTKGYTADGHDFANIAVENGATLIIAEKELDIDLDKAALVVVSDTWKATSRLVNAFYDYPSKKLKMIGVTGTNGKTSVSNLIHSILRLSGKKAGLSGTIGFDLDGVQFPSPNTTSDSLTTARFLRQAVDQGIEYMVMEVSSHGLSLGRLWGVEFDVSIFTNLSHDHLDYHGTMEDYGYAKGLLFSQMGQNYTEQKFVVLNRDDEWFERYSQMTGFEVISYGLENPSDFYASNIQYFHDGMEFEMKTPEGDFHVTSHLLGAFNVYNLLAAAASLYAEGFNVSEIVENMVKLKPVNGRMERVEETGPVSVYIDYAHTPDAIEKAIQAVIPFKKNRIIFLVGTGGNRDKSKRPAMAEMASLADYVVLTTDDPRFESDESILGDLVKGMKHDQYALIGDRAEAVRHATEIAEPGDIIILAGKGHEDYQIVGNEKLPHSDKEIAKEICGRRFL